MPQIDTTTIPRYVSDGLADGVLDLIHRIERQPGGREALDAKTAARRKHEDVHDNHL